MWESLNLSSFITQLPMMGKILFATFLGLILGFEREMAGKPSGIRTSAMVTGTTCLIILLGVEIIDYAEKFSHSTLSADPTRILHAVVVGIGFIGGGMILKKQDSETVENLTSAATILALAALGVAVALEKYYLAIFLTLLDLGINLSLYIIKDKWLK